MTQAENMAATSKSYFNFAYKINGAIGGIQKMAGIAGTKAAWNVAPVAPVPQSHLFPFTPVPPLEFAQTGQSTKVMHHHPQETREEMPSMMAPLPPPPKPPSNFL